MIRISIVSIIVMVAAPAYADDDDIATANAPVRTYLEPVANFSMTFAGKGEVDAFLIGVVGGVRELPSDVWLRGGISIGVGPGDLNTMQLSRNLRDVELRGGIERRRHNKHYIGVDVVAFHGHDREANGDTDEEIDTTLTAVMVVPRAGFNIGSGAVRLRIGAEIGVGAGHIHQITTPPISDQPSIEKTSIEAILEFGVEGGILILF